MKLVVSHSQKLMQSLSTSLIQHLDILQFSSFELEQHIISKGNENPFLNVEDSKVQQQHVDLMQYTTYMNPTRDNKYETDRKFDFIEMKIMQIEPYERSLLEQIPLHMNEQDKKILTYLIQSLDERLFLDINLYEVASIFGTTITHIEDLLVILQQFEPVGIGARNYKEYLLIQINQDKVAPKLATSFILEDLELVSINAIKTLAKKYKVSTTEVNSTIRYIKKLKPFQKIDFVEPTAYIIPDIEIKLNKSEWLIKLNRNYLPSVSINETYIELLQHDPNFQTYYKQSIKDALSLIQGIEQRDKTLYRLAQILIQSQKDFFYKGGDFLKPMRLKDIAYKLNVHQSTISRAIRGKYLKTPHGIFSLQSLFIKGFSNTSGKIDSITYIKQCIKRLIDNESKQTPLSDLQIMQALNDEGIQISRRTVAKYRESMNITSSFNRYSE